MALAKSTVMIYSESSDNRKLIGELLQSDSAIEVVGQSSDTKLVMELLQVINPDLLILDFLVSQKEDFSFSENIIKNYQTRVLILLEKDHHNPFPSLTKCEADRLEIFIKPKDQQFKNTPYAESFKLKVRDFISIKFTMKDSPSKLSEGQSVHKIMAIASSTGGTEALKILLPAFSANIPATLIVQHILPSFTKKYSDILQRMCPFEIKEAEHGDRVMPGRVLLAPGNFHMELVKCGSNYFVHLNQKPIVHGVRPAADCLFKSIAMYAGKNSIGIVLTGMGKDGAEGLLEMKNAGSFNIAQDEKSCVVFGMPKVAIEMGAIHTILPLNKIAGQVMDQLKMQ